MLKLHHDLSSGREPMAPKPQVAVFKTASGSLARKQILADFLQSIAKQPIAQKRLSKVTTTVGFSCHIARLAKLVSNLFGRYCGPILHQCTIVWHS